MDPSNANITLVVDVVLALMGVATLTAYAWPVFCIATRGGKVPVEKFGLPDLLVGGTLIALLVWLTVAGFKTQQRQIHDSDLVDNAITYLIILAFFWSFIHFRGISLATQFGFRTMRLDKVAGLAFLLLLGAYPLILSAGYITQKILGPDAKPQELVKYFVDASQQMNYRTLFYTFFTGTVVAPVAEEFIFRGYIYGVLKRYLGITAGVALNAALFAAVHVNAASLPSLFVFAVCLTLAYEFTGSILVNMCMHSLFNFCAFYLMLNLPSYSQ